MQKNSDDFSMQDVLRMARSEAGQQLFAMLQAQNSEAVGQAMAQASAGNYSGAKEALSSLLASPQVRAMLEQMGRPENE